MLSSETITIALAAIAGIVWLVRLEGRVNAAEKAGAAIASTGEKADEALRLDIVAIKAAQTARDAKHDQTNENLIRMQEQLKYLTNLFERHFVEVQAPASSSKRRTPQS